MFKAAAPDLLAYLARRVGADEAPDLLSETMVIAWRRVKDLPADEEQARMWLFGVARGTLLNHDRASKRRWALLGRLTHHLKSVAPASDVGIEVRDAIARLGADQAEIVRLVHWEGLTLAQAAAVLDIPASTARTRYQRARDALRATLTSASTHA